MPAPDFTPETLAEMHPDLFRANRPHPPVGTFAEQHAAALAVVRQPMPPAACQLLADQALADRRAADRRITDDANDAARRGA